MNRILTLTILLILFSGCDEDTLSNPNENATMENMVGTWNMLSSTMHITTDLDFNTAFLYMYDEENCMGTWEDEDGDGYGCIVSDEMTLILAPLTCEALEGELINNICTYSMEGISCCEESESSTLTIELDGSISMLSIDNEGETIETGTISFNGTDVAMVWGDSSELTGTLSMSGDSLATFTFEIENYMEILLEDEEADQSYIDAVEAGAIFIYNPTMFMIMERMSD